VKCPSGYALSMGEVERDERVRLGGMALPNGVLVHGPSSWACAVRTESGELKVASARKRFPAAKVNRPLLRGPARLLEVLTFLPQVRKRLPEAKLPFERPDVVGSMIASAVVVRVVRESSRISPAARELVVGLLTLAPATLALRTGDLAAYHGAEHISIGTYEHGELRAKEHERCGSHLVGPLIVTSAIAGAIASRVPARLRGTARSVGSLGALAASTEIFGWMVRHPEHRLAKALARPGHELQHRVATAEPTAEQIEVAEAALRACLELEHGDGDSKPA
jgi:uncharacterized protein YqhQ